MTNKGHEKEVPVLLTDKERELLKAAADYYGCTEEEAAEKLTNDAVARRIKRNTGKTKARVFTFKK